MNKLRIKSIGWYKPPLSQIDRINEGFLQNNCELIEDGKVDFIYNHDFSQIEKAYQYKLKYSKSKYLQKVLDLSLHSKPDLNGLKQKLLRADLILTNSQTIQNQVKEYLDLDSVVVYDAIKDVSYNPEIKKEIDFIIIGRNLDPNKRGYLFEQLIELPENKNRIFYSIGPESLPTIKNNYLGIINDETLNQIYNSSKFVCCFGLEEGLNLPLVESLICGSIPIVCKDMTTYKEICPLGFGCESNVESINNLIKELEEDYILYQKIALDYGQKYKIFFDKKTAAKRIIDAFLKLK